MLVGCSVVVWGQQTVSGRIVDAETGEALIGATVIEKGTTNGTITNLDGGFTFSVSSGATLQISYVGYEPIEANASDDLSAISLEISPMGLKEIEVLASVATDRKTPVAVSTIRKEVILEKASNQEFPELLKSTPGVYATKQGGGFGDARVNIRGFNSENVAVLINGIPVNDMESGQVYWSNWAGLTEVTTSMQVQRGLGASKVAVPSIGGTINVITQNTDAEKGGNVYYGIGNDNYRKASFYVSSGLSEEGWAVSFSGARTSGDGYVDGLQFEGYNYFFNISKIINDAHSLSLTGFGAPQRHGQRQTRMTIDQYRGERGIRVNYDYGFLDGELVNVEDNFYHKPQFSLNHYWTINDKMDLSTAAYMSFGTGGGGGEEGTVERRTDGYWDLEATRTINFNNRDRSTGGDGSAIGWLMARRNDHKWYGFLSTLNNQVNSRLNLLLGLDMRYYKGLHFTEVTNQLGAEFVADNNDVNNPNREVQVGDKVSYNNDGVVLWEGGFVQAEYTEGSLDLFANASLSNTSYKRIDHFTYFSEETKEKLSNDLNLLEEYAEALEEGGFEAASRYDQETDWVHYLGYQVKGGGNYRLSRNHNVFANAGYFIKAPDFRSTFVNFSNQINEDAEMQKILSFELGYGFRSSSFNANVNVYRTSWLDRTQVFITEDPNIPGSVWIGNAIGIDALHQGVELDFSYEVSPLVTIRGMASIGDWTWQNNVLDVFMFDESQEVVDTVDLYIAGVKVGNSAQTTASLGLEVKPMQGFKVGFDANYFAANYADFDLDDRGEPTETVVQPWQMPDFFNFDANFTYTFKIGNNEAVFYGNVSNLLNEEYITDAIDASSVDEVRVFFGTGRQWTTGLRLKF